ncbi:DUF58 domain-containing protein [Lapillicoccus sp.]|uniref:DUF58 domain-containing protein n=1 Tax=Lapillicoccus sp. TaxID=1909287 RepID=UPI0025E06807|nr:DUF58 domain-containing protein [Lapillicoccus sp.]
MVMPLAGRLTARVSALGWLTLLLAAVCWALGASFGWRELLMVADAAIVLFVACVVLTLVRARVTIEVEVSPTRVAVGGPVHAAVVVTNRGRLRLLPLLVELPVGPGTVRFTVPSLEAGAGHSEVLAVPSTGRGIVRVGPATTLQGDPLGLVRRRVRWTDVHEVVVHPRTLPIPTLGFGLLRDLEGTETEHRTSADLAFHALREYQPGDDRRHIHWRTSARTGRLQVRQDLDTRRSHVTVVVDTEPQSYADASARHTRADPGTDLRAALRTAIRVDARAAAGSAAPSAAPAEPDGSSPDLETAFSVATSLVLRVLKDRQEASIVCGDIRRQRISAPDLLNDMARTGPHDASLLRQVTAAARLAPETSVAFVVTGPRRSTIDLDRALHQFGTQVRCVVIVVGAATDGIRRLESMLVLSLRDLDDLPRLLAAGLRT